MTPVWVAFSVGMALGAVLVIFILAVAVVVRGENKRSKS